MLDTLVQSSDVLILFATRVVRLFAYGFLSVILVLYLAEVGVSGEEIGLLLTMQQFPAGVPKLCLRTRACASSSLSPYLLVWKETSVVIPL